MPKLTDSNLETLSIKGTGYQYSGVRLENLGATEYTLVTIVVDVSFSVGKFKTDLEKCLKEIVESCRKSPRADNLMLRLVSFSNDVTEEHGYKLLNECNSDDYLYCLNIRNMTALYDASYNSVVAALSYAETLTENDFDVNGVIFILTDGRDNRSTYSAENVKEAIQKAMREEQMESLTTVLIGIDVDADTNQYLTKFKEKAEITNYVELGDANSKNLAKLAEFVSKSISSSSASLGTGQAPSLTF